MRGGGPGLLGPTDAGKSPARSTSSIVSAMTAHSLPPGTAVGSLGLGSRTAVADVRWIGGRTSRPRRSAPPVRRRAACEACEALRERERRVQRTRRHRPCGSGNNRTVTAANLHRCRRRRWPDRCYGGRRVHYVWVGGCGAVSTDATVTARALVVAGAACCHYLSYSGRTSWRVVGGGHLVCMCAHAGSTGLRGASPQPQHARSTAGTFDWPPARDTLAANSFLSFKRVRVRASSLCAIRFARSAASMVFFHSPTRDSATWTDPDRERPPPRRRAHSARCACVLAPLHLAPSS